MKLKLIAIACGSVVLTTACSYTPKEQAQGSFDYVNAETTDGLAPAPGLGLPATTNRYAVPEVITSEPIGDRVVVTAPTIVWPLADGSRVEENETLVRIFFDELEGMNSVSDYVWTSTIQGLAARNIPVASAQTKERLETDWITQTYTLGDDEEELAVSRRFAITMNTAPHGRTTSLLADVIERRESGSAVGNVAAAGQDRSAAARLLNNVVSEIALKQYQGVAGVAEDGSVAIDAGFDQDGSPAMVLSASFNFTWGVIARALEELGFEIDDLNQSTGFYYLEYSRDKSFLSNLAFWRSNKEGKLDIEDGNYSIKVTGDRRQTTVTFYKDEEVFSAEQLNEIFAPVATEIRRQSDL